MTNHEIAQLLRDVAAAYAITNEGKYRFQIIAYEKAADAIEGTTTQLKDLYKENKLENIPGVGSSIKQHLEELFKTGKVKHFDFVMRDIPKSVFPLLSIPGFGPKKAFKLVTHFKLRSPKTIIEDLEKLAKSGKIARLEGFGEKSQSDILTAFAEYKKGFGKTNRMALPFAADLSNKVLEYLQKSKDVIDAEPLGSLRRRVATIGDIDFGVTTKSPKKVIEHFINYPYKERVIEKGDVSSSIIVSGGAQIDLITLPKSQWGSLLQHFTGSKNHNVHLREYSLKKGMSLSERGIKLKINGKQILKEFDTEEKFYNSLGMDWITPEMREDNGEIELAIKHQLPKLVDTADIKADFHLHSSFPVEPSHDMGENSMEEMIAKAKSLGYSYIGFSEHNPSQSKHSAKQIYDILQKRAEHIKKLRIKHTGFGIVSLMETDILPDGSLALDDKSLELLDAAIISIHSVFSMDKIKMTNRVLQGLSHPKAKILAHPTGRILNERTGYELDYEKLFDFCKSHHKALEINAWPYRLDLPDSLVRQGLKYGVKYTIDTDSHKASQMDLMQYGVSVARRGWATKDDILNALEYNEFREWLKK